MPLSPYSVSPPLIRTKLNRPIVSGRLIRRPRLLARLSQRPPLILVCAPAGYGKTTLLSSWLETYDVPGAWFSLDERDNDVMSFLQYMLAAVQRLFPNSCEATLAMVNGRTLPALSTIAHSLVNELDAVEQDFVLVLDDYHLIKEQAIHQLLAQMLRHPPRSLVLVLSTRHDPPLPLTQLRVGNQMIEVRTHDLRFTPQETAAFLQQKLDMTLDGQIVAALEAHTEGWVTGLSLAALFLQRQDDPAAAAMRLQGGSRYTLDYLAAEVLARQPPALQAFLIKTSILERLCDPLCQTVAGLHALPVQDPAYLTQLEDNNAFIFPLDEERTWYRYHRLFQKLLQHQLRQTHTPEDIAVLHLQASAWFAGNGDLEEAIEHAVAAGAEEAVVQLVEANRHAAMNQERWQELEHWLRLIPRQLIDRRPELLMLEAWIWHHQTRMPDVQSHLAFIQRLLEHMPVAEDIRTRMRGEIDTLGSQQFYWQADAANMLASTQRALTLVSFEYSYVRAMAWCYRAMALHLSDGFTAAQDMLRIAFKEDRFQSNTFVARMQLVTNLLRWQTADIPALIRAANQLLALADARTLPESVTWAHYFRGCARYLQGNLAGAESDFVAVTGQRYGAHPFSLFQGLFGLAMTYQAQGSTQRARESVELAVDFAQETQNVRMLVEIGGFQARLALMQGQKAEAYRWAAGFDRSFPRTPMPTFHVTAVALAAILVDQGTPASLQDASHLLTRLHAEVQSMHNTRFLIEVLALQALLYARQGEQGAAQTVLEEAINLARPAGVLRVFVDLGPGLDPLLAQLAQQNGASAFIHQIRSIASRAPARPAAAPAPVAVKPATHEPPFDAYRRSDLATMLTFREMDVLLLLMQRLTNKEIAYQLNISAETVKQHTVKLYRKLQVENRREAIVKARAIGLTSPISPPKL